MTLDEAIRHAEEVAEENYGKATAYLNDREIYKHEEQKCVKCADEHMQLAEWLRDYKRLLEQEPSVSEIPNNCEMRDATLEERESIDKYIKSISKPTGVKFGALEQEPSGDCISRQAVLNTEYQVKIINDIEYVMLSEVQMKMRKLPSVKPQTGHWILQPSNKDQGERDFVWWKCSECGQVIYSGAENDRREFHAFCGRCGARMEVEQNG